MFENMFIVYGVITIVLLVIIILFFLLKDEECETYAKEYKDDDNWGKQG